jgi:hypothetical protein
MRVQLPTISRFLCFDLEKGGFCLGWIVAIFSGVGFVCFASLFAVVGKFNIGKF